MVQVLEELLKYYKGVDFHPHNTAKFFLDVIERRGMEPPLAEFFPIKVEVEGFETLPASLWANKWEPEFASNPETKKEEK